MTDDDHEDDDEDVVTYYEDEDRKIHFTEEGLCHFTEEERGELVELHERRGKKFDEICEHLVSKLGHGPVATLTDEMRAELINKADELAERWDEEVEMSDDPKESDKAFVPDRDLQALLADYHELGEDIMSIRDVASDREYGDDDGEELA